MRRALFSALYWSLVLTASLLFAEFTLWWWGFKVIYVLQAKGVQSTLPFELDRHVLYRLVPSSKNHINSLGFRDNEFLPKGTKRRVVVLGDSFPMGLAVEPQQSFPKKLQSLRPDIEVLNLGIQGYGPDQELLTYRRIKSSVKPDHVIWSLFPSNDLNDLVKNHLFKVGANRELVATTTNPVNEILPALRLPMFLRGLTTGHLLPPTVEHELQRILFVDSETDSPVTVHTFELLGTLLETMRNDLKADRVGLTLVVIPSRDTVSTSPTPSPLDTETIRIAAQLGIPTIDFSQEFLGQITLYSESDHHLSIQGHDVVAKRMSELCNCLGETPRRPQGTEAGL